MNIKKEIMLADLQKHNIDLNIKTKLILQAETTEIIQNRSFRLTDEIHLSYPTNYWFMEKISTIFKNFLKESTDDSIISCDISLLDPYAYQYRDALRYDYKNFITKFNNERNKILKKIHEYKDFLYILAKTDEFYNNTETHILNPIRFLQITKSPSFSYYNENIESFTFKEFQKQLGGYYNPIKFDLLFLTLNTNGFKHWFTKPEIKYIGLIGKSVQTGYNKYW